MIEKILYVAPRFHTNQHYLVKSLIENGIEVNFFVQYIGKVEEHSVLKPILINPMKIFNPLISIYRRINSKNQDIFKFERKYAFPNIISYYKKIKKISPDVVVIRERTMSGIITYLVCKKLSIKTILYNQNPVYYIPSNNRVTGRLLRKFAAALTPEKRITPVLGDINKYQPVDNNSYYVPFVIEPNNLALNRDYYQDKKIKIISIGKFQTRKNHLLLLQVIKSLKEKYPIHLTIVGEVSTDHHKQYYKEVIEYIKKNGLLNDVKIFTNLQHSKVQELYLAHDIFVLPSSSETAGYSILEAMANGLSVICSDTNGTQWYIHKNINGFIFKSDSYKDLEEKIENIISEKENIEKMGQASLSLTTANHSWKKYLDKVNEIIK